MHLIKYNFQNYKEGIRHQSIHQSHSEIYEECNSLALFSFLPFEYLSTDRTKFFKGLLKESSYKFAFRLHIIFRNKDIKPAEFEFSRIIGNIKYSIVSPLRVQRRQSRRVLFRATVDAFTHVFHCHSNSRFALLPIFHVILHKLLEMFASISTQRSMKFSKLGLKLL